MNNIIIPVVGIIYLWSYISYAVCCNLKCKDCLSVIKSLYKMIHLKKQTRGNEYVYKTLLFHILLTLMIYRLVNEVEVTKLLM